MCVCVHSRVCIKILSLQVKKKYNIDIEKLIVLSKRKASLLLTGPNGYWFLIAAALSNRGKPSDNYVLAVYICWNYKKDDVCKSFGKSHSNCTD